MFIFYRKYDRHWKLGIRIFDIDISCSTSDSNILQIREISRRICTVLRCSHSVIEGQVCV